MKISLIIPTVDRFDKLCELLDSCLMQTFNPFEIIVVDQGKITKDNVFKKYSAYLNIKYFKVNFQSLTKARNFGVANSEGEVVSFLDDDIILEKDYFERVEGFFVNNHKALGVQGVITNFVDGHSKKVANNILIYNLYNYFAKIFFLNNSSHHNRLLLSGRNQYAAHVESIESCQWLSGIGNYRREVFKDFCFDEKLLGYALGEDKLFSYSIFLKDKDSLFVDPSIRCEHHHADGGRPSQKDWVDMKVGYTYYLWKKFFYREGFVAHTCYWWANLGDLILVFVSVLVGKNSFKFFVWHLSDYWSILCKRNLII